MVWGEMGVFKIHVVCGLLMYSEEISGHISKRAGEIHTFITQVLMFGVEALLSKEFWHDGADNTLKMEGH